MSDQYKSCIIPWVSTDIVANGDIAPCHVFYDLIMGNLHDNSFEEIWFGTKYQKFRDYISRNQFMSICPGCCILYLSGNKMRKKGSI
ncbi:MAG: SPASM domain-containing protein [Promethearchaeota archaeon]